MKRKSSAGAVLLGVVVASLSVLRFMPFVFAAEHDDTLLPLADSQKKIVEITDTGLVPRRVTLDQADASVFFVNRTRDSLVSMSVAFGKNRVHCASTNIKLDGEGNLSTVLPVAPFDFAILCFPERGTYPYSVQGVGGKTLNGEVVVTE